MCKWIFMAALASIGFRTVVAESASFCEGHPRTSFASPAPISAFGTNRILVIRARMTDDEAEPFTLDEVDEALRGADQLFRGNSYGQFALEWVVTPIVSLPRSHKEYQTGGFYVFLEDARGAAKAAGYDFEEYDLGLTRHTPVNGWKEGEANIGLRGARIASDSAAVITHELGHNFGLYHANFWNTGSPGIAEFASPPFPTNVRELPNPGDIPFDADSFYGHETITGPGESEEYGDVFDIMGSGQERFNACYRRFLGWLPESGVSQATNGVVRLYAIHSPKITPGLSYAWRLLEGGGSERDLWLQYNPGVNPWIDNGVQMHWFPRSFPSSLLLDASPGTPLHREDSELEIGRTFSDPVRGLHLTPFRRGEDEHGAWIELAVRYGNDTTNHRPAVELVAAKAQIEVGEPIELTADASDLDGDALAYHWLTDDGSFTSNTNRIAGLFWKEPGEHVILCEVTDMKGGLAIRHIVIRVGNISTFSVSGFVHDDRGEPLANVRVHNGRAGRDYAGTFTDSRGAYSLTGLTSGSYTNEAFIDGYRTLPGNFAWPVVLQNQSATNINFIAQTIPRVEVRMIPSSVLESSGDAVHIEFTRSGSANEPLTVNFNVSGTATPNRDYPGFLLPRVTFPAGADTVELPLAVFDDELVEGDETITITVVPPGSETRNLGERNEYTVYYPGWELGTILGAEMWFLTYPKYTASPNGATLTIVDDDSLPTVQLDIAIIAGNEAAITIHGTPGFRHVLEMSGDFEKWEVVEESVLESSAWEVKTLLPQVASTRFFRVVRK